MKSTLEILLLFILTNFHWAYAVVTGHTVAIAPFKETYVVDINESEELFENCPTYQLNNPRQVLFHNGWKGNEDFAAQTKIFWSSNSIFFRFDIVDDKYISSSSTPAEFDQINGDFIRINFAHLTCGPDRTSVDPWTVMLLPDTENESCNLNLLVNSDTTRTKIGRVECTLFRTLDGYSIIFKLPYEKWDDLPRRGGVTRLQIVFGDSDSLGQVDHKFVLFPVSRQNIKNVPTDTSQYGNIRYAKNTWVTVYPQRIVYSKHKATFLIDTGNLTAKQTDMHIYPEEVKNKQSFENLEGEHQLTYSLAAETIEQGTQIELNFEALPSGTYRINGKSGVFYDSSAFTIKYSKRSGLLYCPDLIDRRKKTVTRNLSLFENPDLVKTTFSQLAGGGKVLWSVGRYNASSEDFPQHIRKLGRHAISLPEAKEKDVPWALFGGMDALDGMNEPLVIKIGSSLGNNRAKLSPDEPLVQSEKVPPRAVRENYKHLLLIGVVVEYVNEDSFPELHVSTDTKTLLRQTIRPTSYGGEGKRHAYVFRVWLSTLDENIKIENTAIHGSKFEIDFIALLGASTQTDNNTFDDSFANFSGNSDADIFTKQINVSKFLLKYYLVDAEGKAYSSLPGGRKNGVNLRDWGMLTSELAAWGCLDQASALAKKLPLILGSTNISPASKGFTVGNALMVTGIYNTWKKLGENKSFLDPLWLSCIHRPLTQLAKEIETNPLSLIDCTGEFGAGNLENPAVTLPMYFATHSALKSGVAMAKKSGYGENAVSWNIASDRLAAGFKRHLLANDDQVRLVSQDFFPKSWGVDEQQGIVAILPNKAWIYGRFTNRNPVFYNGDIRTFDTPYLLSGVSFWMDYNGLILTEDLDEQLKISFDYMLGFSPLFRKPVWSKFYMVDYNKTVLQLWTVIAGFLLDSIPIATNALVHYIRYSFDEFVPIPEHSDIEVSPYTFEEKLNVSEDGKNEGATHDDLNILNGVTALKTARLILGIDDYDASVLRLSPRLPDGWRRLEAGNWLVNHNSAESGTGKIQYSYEKLSEGRYAMIVESSEKLDGVTVRMGPFSPKTRKVRISGGGIRTDVPTVRHGFYSWAIRTFRKVKSLDVTAQAIVY